MNKMSTPTKTTPSNYSQLWYFLFLLIFTMPYLPFYGAWLSLRYFTPSFSTFLNWLFVFLTIYCFFSFFYTAIQLWRGKTSEKSKEMANTHMNLYYIGFLFLIFSIFRGLVVLTTPWALSFSLLLPLMGILILLLLQFLLSPRSRKSIWQRIRGESNVEQEEEMNRASNRWAKKVALPLSFLILLGSVVASYGVNRGFWRDECSLWKRLQGSTCSILLAKGFYDVAWLGETRWLAYEGLKKSAIDLPRFEGIEGIMDRGQRIATLGETVWEVLVSADYSTAVLNPDFQSNNIILYDIASQTSRLISLPDGYWAETKAGSLSGDGSLIKVYNQSEGAVFDIKRERLLPEITFTGYGHESYRYDYENGELTFFSFDAEGVLTESGRLSVGDANGFAFSARGEFLAFRKEGEIVMINRLTQTQSRFSLGSAYNPDNRSARSKLQFSADGSRLVGLLHYWNRGRDDRSAERGTLFVLQSADGAPLYQTSLYGNLWNEFNVSLNPSPSAETILLSMYDRTLKYEWASQHKK